MATSQWREPLPAMERWISAGNDMFTPLAAGSSSLSLSLSWDLVYPTANWKEILWWLASGRSMCGFLELVSVFICLLLSTLCVDLW
jgi:hypothetical protein